MRATFCEECSERVWGRVDSRYCSNACRQRAYRARSRNAHLFADAAEQRDGHLMGAVDDATFERVLSECRDEGDLSRENVVRKCVTALPVTEDQ